MDFAVFLYGMGVSFSLIVAIGAQNAFVLKQGLKRQYVFVVCAICALCDALLISAGVFGFGALIAKFPLLISIAKYLGALFLFVYGSRSFYNALTQNHALIAQGQDSQSLWQAVMLCLAFTLLNPHVYLDTVILLGSIAAGFSDKTSFAIGAISASFIFFFGLGFGARLLAPIFAKPISWRILDGLIGAVMWALAVMLLIKPIG